MFGKNRKSKKTAQPDLESQRQGAGGTSTHKRSTADPFYPTDGNVSSYSYGAILLTLGQSC